MFKVSTTYLNEEVDFETFGDAVPKNRVLKR